MASFRTKTERVAVTDDELRIDSGPFVQARNYWEGNKILFFSIYVLGPVGILLFGYEALQQGNWNVLLAGVTFVTITYLGLRGYYYRYRGFSSADRIPVDAVKRVTVSERSSNPRLVVEFRADDEPKRRLLLMASGRFTYGDEALDEAIAVFREKGIPVETPTPRNSEPQAVQQ